MEVPVPFLPNPMSASFLTLELVSYLRFLNFGPWWLLGLPSLTLIPHTGAGAALWRYHPETT